MKRRQFLGLSGAALTLPACHKAPQPHSWSGIAMGIAVSVKYHGATESDLHPARAAVAEAEQALSLWSADSALSQLNRQGFLKNPPAALLACLQKARELFDASGGLFDPTVHSFLEWARLVYASGHQPETGALATQLARVDFQQVEFSPTRVSMPPGFALSFNAIAQGYLTDLFAENFPASSALINFGEYRVIGSQPWPVEVRGETRQLTRALAVSSGSGQRLSATSAANHLIDPKTGQSPPPKKVVAVEADEAWLADGLSTIIAIGGSLPKRYHSASVLNSPSEES